MVAATLFFAIGLAIVHIFGGKLTFLEGTPRSVWLSGAGGISVAYVFIHLLPELAKGQEIIRKSVSGMFQALDQHAYLMALAGLVVFYGLERVAKESSKRRKASVKHEAPDKKVFWLHIVSFSIYNVLTGYLLVNDFRSIRPLAFFFVAMALHFIVTDFGLQEQFEETFKSIGRWILSAAVLLGWAVGQFVEIPELATSALVAVLAGGVILNVLKEELPAERRSRFTPFLTGTVLYAVLLLAF